MFQNTILEKVINELQKSGFSWFFVTSSVLTCIIGEKNRNNSLKNAEKDEKFKKMLQQQKEIYEDEKEARDRAFKLWLKQKQREWSREESSKRLENELNKEELGMFFRDWPLEISIGRINEMRRQLTTYSSMNVVIAKHNIGDAKDQLSVFYRDNLVDHVQSYMRDFGLDESKVNIYKFKDKNKVIGGPALANIYAMMNSLPTIVIQPKIDKVNKKLCISLGGWNQDSLFPHQKKVMELNYDMAMVVMDKDYQDMKFKEITYAYVTIAMVINDTNAIIEKGSNLIYPKFAEKYDISVLYPKLAEFAKNEYMSLLNTDINISERDGINNIVVSDYFEHSKLEQIHNELKNGIKQLQYNILCGE